MRIPLDPELPGLHDLLPDRGVPDFVAQAVRAMTGAGIDPEKARTRYVRYRATKSCVVLWALRTLDGRRHWVSARLFHDDRGAAIVARESFQRQAAAAQGVLKSGAPPYQYLADRRVLLQLFPLDARLPALTSAGSRSWAAETFPPLLGAASVRVAAAVPVSYKPWRRCVYRFALEVDGAPRSYFGKLFLDDRGARLLGWLRTIERHLRESAAPWQVIAPVAHVAEARMLLLEAAGDRSLALGDAVKNAARGDGPDAALLRVIERAAEGLPAFQAADLEGLPELPPLAVIADYARGAEGIEAVVPEFAASVGRVMGALEDQARALRPEPLVPVHGAFRYDQFLLAGDEMSVIDLDTLSRSGASADAGNFLGYLDVMAVRRPELRPAIEMCAETFQAAALRLPAVAPEWLSWYRAAAHLKKALRSFYSLDPKWPHTVEELLARAERALAPKAVA